MVKAKAPRLGVKGGIELNAKNEGLGECQGSHGQGRLRLRLKARMKAKAPKAKCQG